MNVEIVTKILQFVFWFTVMFVMAGAMFKCGQYHERINARVNDVSDMKPRRRTKKS